MHRYAREPAGQVRPGSRFDSSPTTWGLAVDTTIVCRRSVYGQNRNADARAAPGDIGRRFRHIYSCGGTTRRGYVRSLGNNFPVGWTYFRYIRKKASAPDWDFDYGHRSVGIRCGVELQFPIGHTARRWSRSSHASHDNDGSAGR